VFQVKAMKQDDNYRFLFWYMVIVLLVIIIVALTIPIH
jgi:hypothetical protein